VVTICQPSDKRAGLGQHNRPIIEGSLSTTAVTSCRNIIVQEEFETLNRWEKRCTAARELFENASFDPDNVTVANGRLYIRSWLESESGDCRDERGGQVTYKERSFSPADNATFSVVMRPASVSGTVSAFFVHFIEGDMHDLSRCDDEKAEIKDTCDNNAEIDIEVVRVTDDKGKDRLRAYFSTWRRALRPWKSCGEWDKDKWERRRQEVNFVELDDKFGEDFHKYSFRWTRDAVDFFIDDKPVARHRCVVPQHAAPLRINAWANKGWSGKYQEKGTTVVERVCVEAPPPDCPQPIDLLPYVPKRSLRDYSPRLPSRNVEWVPAVGTQATDGCRVALAVHDREWFPAAVLYQVEKRPVVVVNNDGWINDLCWSGRWLVAAGGRNDPDHPTVLFINTETGKVLVQQEKPFSAPGRPWSDFWDEALCHDGKVTVTQCEEEYVLSHTRTYPLPP
jgi:hypothetical protein